jgi:hypothetical protein
VLHLREGHHVFQSPAVFLGLGLYSYRVRELLVCWLFLIILFVVLALFILGAVLAWHAGKWTTHWVRTTEQVTPTLALGSAEFTRKHLRCQGAQVTWPEFQKSFNEKGV